MIIRMTCSAGKTEEAKPCRNGKLKRELQRYLHLGGGFLKQSTNKASGWRQGCLKLQEDCGGTLPATPSLVPALPQGQGLPHG